MFFGNIENPKNEKLPDLNVREWVYMAPLVIMSLWVGCYPKSFMDYIKKPVDVVVKQVRPTYPIPGVAPAIQTRVIANPAGVNSQPGITVQPR